MTKPWEETWTDETIFEIGDPSIIRGIHDRSDDERRRLAAQAPAMARLLLKLGAQWGLTDDGYRRCASCEAEGHAVNPVPHTPDCELVAVLRSAGVLP